MTSLTPLYLAAAQLPGQDDIVNYLLDNGASINLEVRVDMLGSESDPQTALSAAMYSAIWTSQSSTAILLISRGASLEYVLPYVFQSNKKPKQHALVKVIQLELVDLGVYLVTAHNIDLKKPDIGEYTDGFEHSVAQCTPEFLQILLGHGLDPNGPGSTWEESFLHGVLHHRIWNFWANTKSSLVYRTHDLVKVLLKAGC